MSLLDEIKRRNVFRVGIAYVIVGWLLVQVAATVFPILQMPEWTVAFVTMLLVLGFPVALILSWAYELTPAGIKRTKVVPLAQSIAGVTGRKLDFVIIALLSLAVVYFVLERFAFEPSAEVPTVADAAAGSDPSPPTAGDDPARDLRSIAALPFSNESAEEENAEFFANGIHDELLTRLAKIGSLKVISRTSVEEYRDATRNMREIGQALGVATLLEGRVQRAGERVRINVQLIDAETDEHLWAEIYDRELTASDIFAVQSEMATEIANALRVVLSPEEAVRLADVPTENTRAYDYYLSGLDYFAQLDRYERLPLAVQQFERAVEEDQDFAVAWAALSRAHMVMYLYALDRTPERLALARAASDRALALAPDAGEPHVALANYYYIGERDYAAARAELAIAEQAMPGSAEVYELRALVVRREGDLNASVARLGARDRARSAQHRHDVSAGRKLPRAARLRARSNASVEPDTRDRARQTSRHCERRAAIPMYSPRRCRGPQGLRGKRTPICRRSVARQLESCPFTSATTTVRSVTSTRGISTSIIGSPPTFRRRATTAQPIGLPSNATALSSSSRRRERILRKRC